MKKTAVPKIAALLTLGVLLLAGGSSAAKEKTPPPLDGKVFTVKLERAGEVQASDTISFVDGRLRSAYFEKRGFNDALYTTVVKDGAVTFTAIAVSDAQGEVRWYGTVRGGSAFGRLLWTKSEEKTVQLMFRGRLSVPPSPGA